MKRNSIFTAILFTSIMIVCGCTDNNIEGTASVTSGFKVNKVSYTNGTVNLGGCSSGSKTGTNFTVTIAYAGSEKITGIKGTYKFITGSTSSNPVTVTLNSGADYVDSSSGGTAGAFRAVAGNSSVANYICLNFGTSTSFQFDYVITTNASKTYNATVTITKPAGAN